MKQITINLTDENHEMLNQLAGFAGITVEELAAQVVGDYIADHAAAAADSAKNVVLATFGDYNERRFSAPWCCTMTVEGKFDFTSRPAVYTGDVRHGTGGDLVVTTPKVGTVYAYGQKDNRSTKSRTLFSKWDGIQFVPCDRLGREKEDE